MAATDLGQMLDKKLLAKNNPQANGLGCDTLRVLMVLVGREKFPFGTAAKMSHLNHSMGGSSGISLKIDIFVQIYILVKICILVKIYMFAKIDIFVKFVIFINR